MKYAIGILLRLAGWGIAGLTVLAALAYIVFCVTWLHAPLADVLRVTVLMAALPIGLGWLCSKLGAWLQRGSAGVIPWRWLVTGIGAAGILGLAWIGHTGLLTDEACGIGLFAQKQDPEKAYARREAEALRTGYERVCWGNLARFDISFKPMAAAMRGLAFAPVDLAQTPFARFVPLGGRSEAVNDTRSRLYRGFRMPDGHVLTLFEHDMSADGVTSWRNPKDEPERIKGMPARFMAMEDTAGTAVSHLSWTEGRRAYELWIDARVVRGPLREQLFALAASLPPSVPACPKEILPTTMGFGPDGAPLREPPPAIMSDADFARLDPRNRPCT